ncbi:MAG TPA: tetratricopeptide repeat protein [Vicinamibacterales bacterium]|nr:tetratricopeptide repeat protein [Vicinamibacterales bacterium]
MTFVQREHSSPALAGQLIVFTGKLSTLGRKDARSLVSRLGGATADDVNARTTMLVIGGEGFAGGASTSNKIRRVEELNAQQGLAIRVLTEEEFCRLVGEPTPSELTRQYYATRDLLARYRALREDHLRYLVKYGVIKAALKTNADTFFAFQDLAPIKQANEEMAEGASFRSVLRTLVASRQGQLAFNFRLDAAPARIVALQPRRPKTLPPEPPPPPRDTARAEDLFRAASELDDGNEATLEQAAALYRKALESDPYLVAALINLANIHYTHHEVVEAQALYERAIGLEADFFEAHFNLGNIHHDLGEYERARACYDEALTLNPYYADTHFYMAVTLEKMGLSNDARPHWRSYRQLAPQGEWVELAREFSE